jgi:hypothetical protein
MKRPISAGDQCLVISGMGRSKSPNVGKTVRVVSLQGEHSQHGRVWRCEGKGIQQMTDAGTYVETNVADFSVAWIVRIDPVAPGLTTKVEEGIEA